MGADGEQIGVIDTREALRQARELDLDLVEVAPQATPPVCRIMDYGKFKYERDVRQKEARKKQSRTGLKEIKFRPKIDPHDYATKKGHVVRFLNGGQQGQGDDHVPRARDGPHGARPQDPRPTRRRPGRDDRRRVDAQAGRAQHDHGDLAQQDATWRRRRGPPRRPRPKPPGIRADRRRPRPTMPSPPRSPDVERPTRSRPQRPRPKSSVEG